MLNVKLSRFGSMLAFVCALAVLGSTATAQGKSHSSKDCAHAAKIIRSGHPARKIPDARARLGACGKAGADALAAGMSRLASSTDTVALDALTLSVGKWRDATLLTTASRIANDPTSSVEARVFAIRYLVRLLNPAFLFRYGDMIASSNIVADTVDHVISYYFGCKTILSSSTQHVLGTPLPAGYHGQIREMLARIARDSTQPTGVRAAAGCADAVVVDG